MPPERHSSPPPRPPRDRHTGGSFPGPRRFGGGGFAGGGPRDGGPRPPFPPRPAPPQEPSQSIRLREGDREVEIHGSASFVRQTLDELPTLFARLRGEAVPATRPASISMPRPPRATDADPEPEEPEEEEEFEDDAPPARHRERHGQAAAAAKVGGRATREKGGPAGTNGRKANGSLEDRIFRTLERADHPLSVAAIRKQIGTDTTGQQIRRILERAADRVVATTERPAAYALR